MQIVPRNVVRSQVLSYVDPVDCSEKEKAEDLIDLMVETFDTEVSPDDIEVYVSRDCMAKTRKDWKYAAGEVVPLWKVIDHDNEYYAQPQGYVMNLNKRVIDKYGWKLYRHIVAHEFAHCEMHERMQERIYTDGDPEFEELVREFGGSVRVGEINRAQRGGEVPHFSNLP